MKGLFSRVLVSGLLLGSSLVAMSGCGNGGSNDQGVAFTLNGFFTDSTAATGTTGSVATFGSSVGTIAVQVQNNLIGQGIRFRRLYLSYNIPGSGISLPSTSVGLTGVLGPVECSAGPAVPECVDTTLPPAFMQANINTAEFNPVPGVINDYLVLNRNSLPQLPFSMEITVVAEGITTGGDTLLSNEGIYSVEYRSDSGVADPAA